MLIEAKDEYLTPALVAARFKVSIPTVYRWMSPEDPAAPGEPTNRVICSLIHRGGAAPR